MSGCGEYRSYVSGLKSPHVRHSLIAFSLLYSKTSSCFDLSVGLVGWTRHSDLWTIGITKILTCIS